MAESFVEIGHTKKSHGVQGWLRVLIEPQYLEDIFEASALFISMSGQPVPYFIDGFDTKNELLVKLEDIDSKEAAAELSGKTILLRSKDLIPEEERNFILEEESLEFAFLIGFEIEALDKGSIGRIQEVLDFPQQEMAIVDLHGKELLIPLHNDFIQSINEDQKKGSNGSARRSGRSIVMRILGEIPHQSYKITVFHSNNRLMLKLERGLLEQTYKMREAENLSSFQDLARLVTPSFLQKVDHLFRIMEANRHQLLSNLPEEDSFEEII